MAQTVTLTGAQCKIILAGTVYPADSIVWTEDYGEQEIYGIDSVHPQEIAVTRIAYQGTITGFRTQQDGDLQAKDIRPKIIDTLNAPYISLRVQDRKNNEDLLYAPQIKITNKNTTISAKGVVKTTFSFKAVVMYNPLDRS